MTDGWVDESLPLEMFIISTSDRCVSMFPLFRVLDLRHLKVYVVAMGMG